MPLFRGPIAGAISPLRYPGGKGSLAPFLGALIKAQEANIKTFVEPFAGGAGAALRLLYDEHVERIVLNDLDRGVAAMWRSIFGRTDAFIALLMSRPITVDQWHLEREIATASGGEDDLALGFATFFLNRTNRSGIHNARPIGGLDQAGKWKIDARFNRESLADRVSMLGQYRNRVLILEEDGIDVTQRYLRGQGSVFVYADPPYIEKGSDLYLNQMSWDDHRRLAEVLQSRSSFWMLTYDHDDRVPALLYAGRRYLAFDIAHTAAVQHVGQEYAVFSDSLLLRERELEMLTRRGGRKSRTVSE